MEEVCQMKRLRKAKMKKARMKITVARNLVLVAVAVAAPVSKLTF